MMSEKSVLVKILKENCLLPLLILLLLLLSLLPLLYEFSLPAPGKVKLFWHNYPYDFTYYRSVILQGREGNFFLQNRYTIEPHQPIFIRTFYLFLGHLSRILRIDPTLIYHLSRIFLGAVFLLLVVCFIQAYFQKKEKRFVAYLLAFFVGGFPKDKWPYLPFLTELQITRRVTFLPHFLLGYIGLILLILFLYRPTIRGVPPTGGPPRRRDYRFPLKFLLVTLLLGFAGLNHPQSLIFFFPLMMVFLFLLFLTSQPLKTKIPFLKLTLISFLILYPFLYYLFLNLTKPPWNMINKYQVSLGGSFLEYLLALGPNAFLAIGGVVLTLITILKRKKVPLLRIMAASWFLTSNLLVLLARFKGFYAETRFTQVALFLPMALLATDFIFFIGHTLLTRCHLVRGVAFTTAILLILITLPAQISLYREQFAEAKDYCQQKLPQLPYLPTADYPPVQLMAAIIWLGKNTFKNEVVLSQFYAGNLIPAYAGNFVYLGHQSETINFEEKSEKVNKFFSGKPSEQMYFLKKNRIKYLFYGPQEKSLGQLLISELPIHPVFQNELVTIFEVKDEV